MEPTWLVVRAIRIPVTVDEFVIGRDEGCSPVIDERAVSKRHVALYTQDGTWRFRDLGSARGVLHNGEAVEDGPLAPGDVLDVGGVEVWFQAEPRRAHAGPATVTAALPGRAIDWKPFEAFFERLRATVEPRDLLERLLLGLVDIFGAERGFVLVDDGSAGGEMRTVVAHKLDDAEGFVAISRTITAKAMQDGVTVFVPNTMHDQWYLAATQNRLDGVARSVVCGCLSAGGRTFGTIYVDGPPGLDERHVALFDVVSGMAAELLAAASTRKKLLAARGHIAALSALPWEDEKLVLGDGPHARELRKQLEVVASQDVSVLITGETGTGKEMVARALHRLSHRRHGAFVPVNCAALPLDIIEAELFGAEKGAFTGAVERRVGRFELAAGGTLFLDEVGELSPELQVKLLRVFQERAISRLGGTKVIPLDFRLMCATNQNLEQAVQDGSFRSDLYYRINVFRLQLEPLREQPESIMPLARHFLKVFGVRFGRSFRGFNRAAEVVLTSYPWPGNVRELRNAVERAALVETEGEIRPESLPVLTGATRTGEPMRRAASSAEGVAAMPLEYRAAKKDFEQRFFERALRLNENNVTNVARETGLTRKTIYNKLEQLGMVVPRDESE